MPTKPTKNATVDADQPYETKPLRTVSAGLKKLDPQMLRLIVGHNPDLLEFLQKKGSKAGLPPSFIVANLVAVISHVLAPGLPPCHTDRLAARTAHSCRHARTAKTAFQKSEQFTLLVHSINYILIIGESGTGKSPVGHHPLRHPTAADPLQASPRVPAQARNLLTKALELATGELSKAEGIPADLCARLQGIKESIVFDASSGGILDVLKAQRVTAPKALMLCDELLGAASRWAAGAAGKTGSPAELSTLISLHQVGSKYDCFLQTPTLIKRKPT